MARQKNQSYKKTQSYKEIQADWRWIRSMDPKAASEALQWMNEHPNERKELERILYYSEADFKKKFSSEELELAEKKAPICFSSHSKAHSLTIFSSGICTPPFLAVQTHTTEATKYPEKYHSGDNFSYFFS